MRLEDKVVVITGAASGIGAAAARRFAKEGVAGLVIADPDVARLRKVAAEVNGLALPCDVSKEADIRNVVAQAEAEHGRIDVYFSNAGVIARGGLEAPDEEWERNWKVHVMAHVWAARSR